MRHAQPIIAIGGVGGSGTRVYASALKALGYYIGDDLNSALDNLTFTLLFKRRAILLSTDTEFEALWRAFSQSMSGQRITDCPKGYEPDLTQARPQHDADWLEQRWAHLCGASPRQTGLSPAWGWKEPNTHLVIERLLKLEPLLKYIHITRHGVDLALNRNQNQLALWGPLIDDAGLERTPRAALRYWCYVYRRVENLRRRYPERVLHLRYDDLLEHPRAEIDKLAAWADRQPTGPMYEEVIQSIGKPPSAQAFMSTDLTLFDRNDLKFLLTAGFALPDQRAS